LTSVKTSTGESLEQLSHAAPLLVVFLRHQGCPFCRETLSKLEQRRQEIEAAGVKIVLVHMIPSDNEAEMFFARWRLHDVPRISDPERDVYKRFGLARGSTWQVLGPSAVWRGFSAFVRGNLPGVPQGDVFQLPGAFLVEDGQIVRGFRAKSSGEQANFDELLACDSRSCER
jgi:hypothetical protein